MQDGIVKAVFESMQVTVTKVTRTVTEIPKMVNTAAPQTAVNKAPGSLNLEFAQL